MPLTAKKLSPGKVEDQENASVARPTHKRSADALLTPSVSAKTDPVISLAKVCLISDLMSIIKAEVCLIRGLISSAFSKTGYVII